MHKHLTRSVLRRAAGEYPVGSSELGYFDPVTAMAASTAASVGGQVYAAKQQEKGINRARQDERMRLRQLAPYQQAGTQALEQFQGNLTGQPSYADVLARLQSDPGYQFEMQQGQDAIQGAAAARGLLRSGRTLKDLVGYAQGLASQRAGDAYTRELNAFTTQQNQLLQLMQAGQSAAGANSNLGQLALAQGQNSANLGVNLANVATNAMGNLAFANMLQQPGAGAAPGAPNYGALNMSQQAMPSLSSVAPRNSAGYFNPMGP